MKVTNNFFRHLASIATLVGAIGFTACQKETNETTPVTIENPDKANAKLGADKTNLNPDSLTQSLVLTEGDKQESTTKTGHKTLAAVPTKVKVKVKLVSIQCLSVSDGRTNEEELYGSISASVCAKIAPNNGCNVAANFITQESRGFQRTEERFLSYNLFTVSRNGYINFAKHTVQPLNSVNVFEYSYRDHYFPTLKLAANLWENDFDGWRDSDDRYYFIGGAPSYNLVSLTPNKIYVEQKQVGDNTSRYLLTYTIEKTFH